jgi:ABC-2 type transport system permease protein/lipopolysaccharide transport system permease protein
VAGLIASVSGNGRAPARPAELRPDPPARPPAGTERFRYRFRFITAMAELWRARELIRTLAERELRARYKQALLGVSWAIITPLALMTVFSVSVARVADVETGGVPYALFAYLGLLPWMFFSTTVTHGGLSLLNNVALLNKVACPREVFPMASVGMAAVDATVAALGFGALLVVFTYAPRTTAVWMPVLMLVQVAFTLGVALVVSAIVLYFRDLRHVLPLLLQIGLFATPVAYGLDVVPERWQPLYAALNPLGPVIDGYRRTVLLGQPPDLRLLAIAAVSSAVVLVSAYLLFKHLEKGFADIA